MNESGYTRTVNQRLPLDIYSWKINAQFAPGVPDCWYSGAARDLWVEWKYLKTMNKHRLKPSLRSKQVEWLRDRYEQGRNVIVLVGSPQGIVAFNDLKWEKSQKVLQVHSRDAIVGFLTRFLRGQDDHLIQL